MPEHAQLDEHGHPIINTFDQWGADPVGDPDFYGNGGDDAIAARIRASRERMLADPGPALYLVVPR